jgi:hypothetical protein
MYEELLGEIGFYRLLLRFDEDLAAATRVLGCLRCGEALHVADYRRKPRGVPPGLGDRYRKLLLRGPAVSQAPHMPLTALSEPQGISGRGGGAGLGSALRIDTAAPAVSAGVGRGEPADDPALAAVVVGGLHRDTVLACSRRHTAAAAGTIAITGRAPGAFCRHKKSSGRIRAGQALRGSSEFHAWGDSNLYLRRTANTLTLTIEHRAAASPPTLTLELQTQGDALALQLAQTLADPTPAPASVDERIAAALMQAGRPLPIGELRTLCRLRNATLHQRLAALTQAGRLVRSPDGYCLATTTA